MWREIHYLCIWVINKHYNVYNQWRIILILSDIILTLHYLYYKTSLIFFFLFEPWSESTLCDLKILQVSTYRNGGVMIWERRWFWRINQSILFIYSSGSPLFPGVWTKGLGKTEKEVKIILRSSFPVMIEISLLMRHMVYLWRQLYRDSNYKKWRGIGRRNDWKIKLIFGNPLWHLKCGQMDTHHYTSTLVFLRYGGISPANSPNFFKKRCWGLSWPLLS